MLVALEGIDGAGKRTQAERLAARARAEGLDTEVLAFPRYGETFFADAVRELLGGGFGSGGGAGGAGAGQAAGSGGGGAGGGARANDPRLVGLLFAGDRLESRPLIEQALERADLVLVDRYVASNLAYQAARAEVTAAAAAGAAGAAGAAAAAGAEVTVAAAGAAAGVTAGAAAVSAWLEAVEHDVYGLPRPELTLLYDLPVTLAVERLAARAPAGGRPSGDVYEADREFLEACRRAYLALAAGRPDWAVISLVDDAGPLTAEAVAARGWAVLEAQLRR